jgi:hypothetical protein
MKSIFNSIRLGIKKGLIINLFSFFLFCFFNELFLRLMLIVVIFNIYHKGFMSLIKKIISLFNSLSFYNILGFVLGFVFLFIIGFKLYLTLEGRYLGFMLGFVLSGLISFFVLDKFNYSEI